MHVPGDLATRCHHPVIWYGHLRCKDGYPTLLARRYRPHGHSDEFSHAEDGSLADPQASRIPAWRTVDAETPVMPQSARSGAELTPFARQPLLRQRVGASCRPTTDHRVEQRDARLSVDYAGLVRGLAMPLAPADLGVSLLDAVARW